jgi:ketosteroid isomerase-like protein
MSNTGKKHQLSGLVFEAMNARDFSIFEKNITEDISIDFPGLGRKEGSRRTLLLMKSLLRKYPRLHFTVNDIIVEGNRACVVWTNEGEDIKGNPYENSGATILHFEDERIFFISDYFKDTSFTESA